MVTAICTTKYVHSSHGIGSMAEAAWFVLMSKKKGFALRYNVDTCVARAMVSP